MTVLLANPHASLGHMDLISNSSEFNFFPFFFFFFLQRRSFFPPLIVRYTTYIYIYIYLFIRPRYLRSVDNNGLEKTPPPRVFILPRHTRISSRKWALALQFDRQFVQFEIIFRQSGEPLCHKVCVETIVNSVGNDFALTSDAFSPYLSLSLSRIARLNIYLCRSIDKWRTKV